MVVVFVIAGLVVALLGAVAAGSRDSSRRRREWRAQAAAVRERNECRAERYAHRYDGLVPGPRESPEDSGHWLVRR